MSLSTRSLASASANHPWRTVVLWIMVIAVAVALNATLLADALTNEFGFTIEPDSVKGERLLKERLRETKITEAVIVQSQTLNVDDPAFRTRVESLHKQVIALGTGKVESGDNYYMGNVESLVSADRQTTILSFTMAGDLVDATDNGGDLLEIVMAANGTDGFRVLVAGQGSIAHETNELTTKDIEKGERVGIPSALVILLVLFGAVVAALIPIMLAIISIVVALGATAILGQFIELIFFVTLIITMIGLAVGIDYSLIVVSRFREEMRSGRDKIDAIVRTGDTAGRTVFFSGATVVVAMTGMLVIPSTVYLALGLGAILVVIAAVAGALTLLPAVLSLLGPRVNFLRLPFVGRRLKQETASSSEGGFWSWTVRIVMRYPIISFVLVGGLMLVPASQLFNMHTGFNGVDTYPDGVQGKEAFLIMEEKFSFGLVAPVEIVIVGNTNSQPVKDAIERLNQLLRDDTDFDGEPSVQANADGDLALVSIRARGEPSSDRTVSAVERLRNEYVPSAFSSTDTEVLVSGVTAFNIDFFDLVDLWTPIVFAVVLGLSFILLTIAFRSIVIPIKAIIMNLLSVGAAYGLLVLIFQEGVGADLLGFQQTPTIEAWIPVFLFAILFGLSMDYQVFLMSRIRERYDQTGDTAGAVAYGLRATAGLITGAALIMVAVFGGFAASDFIGNQQVGFGLAAAIFIDATLVRTVLVPSAMRLLGRANWYLPSWLEWLPDMRVEAETPAEAPATGD